jgi:aromatic amino acid aminotransferase I
MIPMAGGIPSPEYFPFESLSAEILPVDHVPLDNPRTPKKAWFDWTFGYKKLEKISVPKYVHDAKPTDLQLATSLQYQAATGPPALPLFLRKYVETVFKPAYADWDVLLNVGNTDGWSKIVGMLMEKGDAVLVEECTYPGAENAFLPLECEMVAIKMDGEGVIPAHMDKVLGEWDEEKRGKKRPHVFYTIPTGQNPTGATMLEKRKREVYEVCRKYGESLTPSLDINLTNRCDHLRGRAILLPIRR